MVLYAFGAHNPEAATLRAEVSDGLLSMTIAGDVIVKVGLHVLEGEAFGHLHGGWKLNINEKAHGRGLRVAPYCPATLCARTFL